MKFPSTIGYLFVLAISSCNVAFAGDVDYFLLRPGVEKAYGYSHAVKIGNGLALPGFMIEIELEAHKAD